MPELAYKRNVGAPGLSLIVIKALSAELANNRWLSRRSSSSIRRVCFRA